MRFHHTLAPMHFVPTLVLALTATLFESTLDRGFASFQKGDWATAASSLDQAYALDAATFDANNLHYLRGRIAENQRNWQLAQDEFRRAGNDNPLHSLAVWHAAKVSLQLHDLPAAQTFFVMLPRNFPEELRMQIAREAGGAFALAIYQDLVSREARLYRAKTAGDAAALWALMRENKDDDTGLEAARLVASTASSPQLQVEVAQAFAAHRQATEAVALYKTAANDPMFAADARYQIARIHFQQEQYQAALDEFRAIAKDFEDSDWQKESEYQIASCFWRLGDFKNAEKAYVDYIRKYGHNGMEEAATRNLADVYRVLGENQKAIALLDKALAARLSLATRQVFLFTKAKILYTQKRYAPALALFQQLARTKLRAAPGSATAEEVEYLQALCQSQLGNKGAAKLIWQRLAREEFSYYGQRSAEKLGKSAATNSANSCLSEQTSIGKTMESELENVRHPLRPELDRSADAASELIFLHLWDEAAAWMDPSSNRLTRRSAAQIAYLGGQYARAISLADRLPRSGSTMPLVYPAGYAGTICEAAGTYKVDPLWLHAIVWQESKYNPQSKSGAAARGLMQFIPETARNVASAIGMSDVSVEKLYDPQISIRLGAAYWSSLMTNLKNPEMALAAYNGGPDNVQRWMAKSADPELFVSDIGFVETKKYVMLVFAARAAYASLLN